MSKEKAIEMLQNLRNSELYSVKLFSDNDPMQKDIKLISQAKVNYLEKILHELEPETYPCNHPREFHDICKGQLYCVGCNQDL